MTISHDIRNCSMGRFVNYFLVNAEHYFKQKIVLRYVTISPRILVWKKNIKTTGSVQRL